MNRGFPETTRTPSSGRWAVNTPIILDGRPFTFDRHEYLMEPYRDDHPYMVEMKAAQLGLTSKAMLQAIYGCRYGDLRGSSTCSLQNPM